MKSVRGTKTIVQIANEMKDKDSDEWLDVVKVWKASKQKPNGTWSIPNGEEIMNKLQEEGEKNKEIISSAPQPLVEHFGLVIERKSTYACDLGLKGITYKSQEKSQILAENAKKRANDLASEVARLTEMSKKQDEHIQAQQTALDEQAMELKQVSTVFAHLANIGVIPNVLLNASSSSLPTADSSISHSSHDTNE